MMKLMFKKILSALIMLFFVVSSAVEFDSFILEDLGHSDVDLTHFSGSSDRFVNESRADVFINGVLALPGQDLYYYEDPSKGVDKNICFTAALLESMPLKAGAIEQIGKGEVHETDKGACFSLSALEFTSIKVEERGGKVDIEIPQTYLMNYDPTWVPPSKIDHGVGGVIIDYSLVAGYSRFKGRNSETDFRSTGTIGANLGRFRLRSDYQYDSKADSDRFRWQQTYLFTDISSLNSKLYAGEIYTRSNIFEGTRIKGASVFTDEDMMPAFLQGYAPQITGVADSDSIVTVKQYGAIIRVIQVPQGPFVISDLPSYLSGLVDVEIEGDNNNVVKYQMDITQVPFLTRKGSLRYSFNVGKIDRFDKKYDDNTVLITGEASYGLSNNISIFGGGMQTTNNAFKSYAMGLGLELGVIGGLSFDMIRSISNPKYGRELKGNSFRFNYAKRFGQNTSLNLAGYRYSSRGYRTINNYIGQESSDSLAYSYEKNRFTISFSQFLPTLGGSVSLSATRGSYWNKKTIESYDVTYSTYVRKGFFENTTLQVSASRYKNHYGQNDDRVSFYMTIPLKSRDFERRLSYQINADKSDRISQNIGYHQPLFGGNASLSLSSYNKRDFSGSIDYSLNGSFDKEMLFGDLNVSAGYSKDYQRVTASYAGSVTLTDAGLATHRRVYNDGARLILNTGASNVYIEENNRSNTFGLLGVSNIPAYSYRTYKIDNDNLPENVEIQDGVVNLAVSGGAIAYRSLGGIVGEKSLVTINLSSGGHPPFGAVVYRENGSDSEVGLVAGNGLTYLTGINAKSKFNVVWAGGSCSLMVESFSAESSDQNLVCYMD